PIGSVPSLVRVRRRIVPTSEIDDPAQIVLGNPSGMAFEVPIALRFALTQTKERATPRRLPRRNRGTLPASGDSTRECRSMSDPNEPLSVPALDLKAQYRT